MRRAQMRHDALWELYKDAERRYECLNSVPSLLETTTEFQLLHERARMALEHLRSLKGKAFGGMREQNELASCLRTELETEAIAYQDAFQRLRLGEVYVLDTGERIMVYDISLWDPDAEIGAGLLAEGFRVRKDGQLGAAWNLFSSILDANEKPVVDERKPLEEDVVTC
jgi:hypothetical protein